MQIIAKCPGCSSNWRMNGSAADRRVRCKKCGRLFKVPKLEELPDAAKVVGMAKGELYVDQNGNMYG